MDVLQCLWLAQLVRNIDELTEAGEGGVEAMLQEATAEEQLGTRRKRIDAGEARDVTANFRSNVVGRGFCTCFF